MATSYKTPLERYKTKKTQRPTDAATVRPPAPKRPEPPAESYREFLRRVWRESGYNFRPANPGDVIEGSCPYHSKTRRVYNDHLISICLQCYPELDPDTQNTERTQNEESILDH